MRPAAGQIGGATAGSHTRCNPPRGWRAAAQAAWPLAISNGRPARRAGASLRHAAASRRVATQVARPSSAAGAGGSSGDSDGTRANDPAAGSSAAAPGGPDPAAAPAGTGGGGGWAWAQAETPVESGSGDEAAAAGGAGAASGPVPTAPTVDAAAAEAAPRATAGGGGGSGSAVSLLTRYNGVGYTFVLAGFLKILTMGGLVMSAPVDTARTAFGKASPYLLVPVGLGLCWAAKQAVDSGLNESKRFLQVMVGVLVLLYFGLVKLMYRYVPSGEWVRRPRPRLPGPLAEVRAELGDKDLLAGAGGLSDSRSYLPERPGRELYDDVAWYEGRYPSQLAGAGAAAEGGGGGLGRGRAALAGRVGARAAAAAAPGTDEEYGGAAGLENLLRARGAPDVAAAGRRSFLSDSQR